MTIKKLLFRCYTLLSLKKNIKISYGITVCNESEELNKLLTCLIANIDTDDEIVILSDKSNVTNEVLAVINKFGTNPQNIKHISSPLNNDFATFKNNLLTEATGDYLFQIDADEIPSKHLLHNVKSYLDYYKRYDCFCIPRVNLVDGISDEYIKKWNWIIDDKSRINYPDLQMRLFKLNTNIKWVNKVHEVLINYTKSKNLPHKTEENCLYHFKHINKQIRQNNYYDTL